MARIVIADDDADIRELVVFKLRHGGHEVVPVGDGAAAVEACRHEKPDLVILDVMMPGMSGLDAARAPRQDPTMDGLPIIMLTARAQESDIEQGFEAGADDYVVKPFSPRELACAGRAVLAPQPLTGPAASTHSRRPARRRPVRSPGCARPCELLGHDGRYTVTLGGLDGHARAPRPSLCAVRRVIGRARSSWASSTTRLCPAADRQQERACRR